MNIIKLSALTAVFILSGCYGNDKNQKHEYDWAVEFCGGKSNVFRMDFYQYIPSKVQCMNGQYVDIPEGV